MKKLTNGILTTVSLVGAFLVSENMITTGQLTDIQSILGLALAGGGISIGMIITIIRAIPSQLVKEAFSKLVEKYGEDKVLNVLNTFDQILSAQQELDTKLDTIQTELQEAKEAREALLNE